MTNQSFKLCTATLPSNSGALLDCHLPLSGCIKPFGLSQDGITEARRERCKESLKESLKESRAVFPKGRREKADVEVPPLLVEVARCGKCYAFMNPTSTILGSRSFCCGLCGAVTSFIDAFPASNGPIKALTERYFRPRGFGRHTTLDRTLPELSSHNNDFSISISDNNKNDSLALDLSSCAPLVAFLFDASLPPSSLEFATECVANLLQTAPPQAKIALLLFGATSTEKVQVSFFDLSKASSSSSPNLITADLPSFPATLVVDADVAASDERRRCCALPDPDPVALEDLLDFCDLECLFQPIGEARPAVEEALRVIADLHALNGRASSGVLHGVHGNGLGVAVDALATLLQGLAVHPGSSMYSSMHEDDFEEGPSGTYDQAVIRLSYLGAKVSIQVRLPPTYALAAQGIHSKRRRFLIK